MGVDTFTAPFESNIQRCELLLGTNVAGVSLRPKVNGDHESSLITCNLCISLKCLKQTCVDFRLVLCRFAGFKYSRGEQEDRLGLIDLSRLRFPSTVFNEHFRPQCLNTKHTQSNTLDLNTLTENTADTVTLNTETQFLGPSVIEHTCVNNL